MPSPMFQSTQQSVQGTVVPDGFADTLTGTGAHLSWSYIWYPYGRGVVQLQLINDSPALSNLRF